MAFSGKHILAFENGCFWITCIRSRNYSFRIIIDVFGSHT